MKKNILLFGLLFLLTIIIVLFSSFPLLKIAKIDEQFTFTVRQTYRELFSKKNRHLFVGHFADGAQAWIGAVVWPVFIFLCNLACNVLSLYRPCTGMASYCYRCCGKFVYLVWVVCLYNYLFVSPYIA